MGLKIYLLGIAIIILGITLFYIPAMNTVGGIFVLVGIILYLLDK